MDVGHRRGVAKYLVAGPHRRGDTFQFVVVAQCRPDRQLGNSPGAPLINSKMIEFAPLDGRTSLLRQARQSEK